MKSSTRRALVAGTTVAVGLSLAAPTGAMAARSVSQGGRAALTHSHPQWAARAIANAPASKSVNLRVYLNAHNAAALDALATAVSDPHSAQYRHYLSADAYSARFAPTAADLAAVGSWLKDAGLKVTGVGAGNRWVSVGGTVAQANSAFGVKLALFSHNGSAVQAPSTDASVPSKVAGLVAGVSGLDESPHIVKPASAPAAPPPPAFVNGRPCSTYYGQLLAKYQADFSTPLPKFEGKTRPFAVCGYVPVQLRLAYEGQTSGALTGAGATIAITDAYAAPTIKADANAYATKHGDAAFAPGQFSQVLPSSFTNQALCGPSGWYGEETLDVEASHGMAPDANVIYYASRSCFDSDFLDTLGRVVDDNKASIVSNSWSDVEEAESSGTINAYETVFKQGAVQGIGFFFSSGDNGDELGRTGLVQVDYPASDPWATAVGGTSLAVGPAGNYMFEAGWGTDKFSLNAAGTGWDSIGMLYGAGGGFSHLFNRPSYQLGVVNRDAPGRAVPDIGLDADPTTGMLIGETQTFPNGAHYGEYRIGGTSLASPLMAGIQALAVQKQGRLGFANPRIYDLARTGSRGLRDVTAAHDGDANVRVDNANGLNPSAGLLYSVRTFGDDSSLNAAVGWDSVTGVGSPTPSYARQ